MIDQIKEALHRYIKLVMNPEEELNLIASEKPSFAETLFPFSTIGVLLLIIFFSIGYLLRSFRANYLLELTLTLLYYLAPLAAFTFVSTSSAKKMEAVQPKLTTVVALYSFAPCWLISIMNVIPVVSFGWLWIILSIIFTSMIFEKASVNVIGIPEMKNKSYLFICISTLSTTMVLLFLIKFIWLVSKGIT